MKDDKYRLATTHQLRLMESLSNQPRTWLAKECLKSYGKIPEDLTIHEATRVLNALIIYGGVV